MVNFKLPNTRFKFMSVIGGAIIGVYLMIITYQVIQVNYQFNHGKLPIEVYERLSTQRDLKIGEIVLIIMYFFFRGQSGKIEDNKTEEK